MNKPKIYDCFTFFNENELLELRLMTLYNTVDYFVIVEAGQTFTGKPKPFNLIIPEQYTEKIRYIKLATLPSMSSSSAIALSMGCMTLPPMTLLLSLM
jgi:hypothetical protein